MSFIVQPSLESKDYVDKVRNFNGIHRDDRPSCFFSKTSISQAKRINFPMRYCDLVDWYISKRIEDLRLTSL